MRYGHSSFTMLALLTAATISGACGGAATTDETADSAAAAAAAAPPPAEAFTLMGDDGSWSGEITPAGIVYKARGRDSLKFEFKAPTVNGAISDYEVLKTDQDTVRISISLATTSCTDKSGATYTHMAQVFLSGKQGGRDVGTSVRGCASRK